MNANILAAILTDPDAVNRVYNIAAGERTSLKDLFYIIRDALGKRDAKIKKVEPQYGPFRSGDLKHSQADIAKVKSCLGYKPAFDVADGLEKTVEWYVENS